MVLDKLYKSSVRTQKGKDFVQPRRGMGKAGVESERTIEGRHFERRKKTQTP